MTERAKKLLLLYCKQGGKIRRVSGLPLLTFKGKGKDLKNYRIYGNTETLTRSYSGSAPLSFPIEDGAVSNYRVYGQTSRNLFDFGEWSKNINANNDNSLVKSIDGITITANSDDAFTAPYAYAHEGVYKIYVKPNTNYLLSWVSNNNLYGRVFVFKNGAVDKSHMINVNNAEKKYLLFDTDTNTEFVTLRFGVSNAGDSITYSKIMLIEGSTALPYEPYGESVGDRTRNILPMPTTPIDTIIDDFHCEYDGMGTIKLTALTDNAVLSGFTVPLSKEFIIPLSVMKGGTGCWQMNNDVAYMNVNGSPSFILELRDNTDIRDYWNLNIINRVNFDYTLMGGTNINSIKIRTVADVATNIQTGQTLTISPAFVENVTEQVPFEPYGYRIPITNNSETANIYLDEPLRKVGDEAEYVDYATQKWHRVRKNLLQNTATSKTINGVTFTVNSDGSIVCDGQASPHTATLVYSDFLAPSGTYILTGCPNGGSESETYKMLLFINGAWLANDTGSGVIFTLTKTSTVSARIDIYNGYTCDNLTFYPMLRLASIEDDTYEPYIANTEVDVTLPALPAQSSTNSLSVGTSVQPSSVAVEVNEIVSCGNKTRNLFDGEFLQGYWAYADGVWTQINTWIATKKIPCKSSTTYAFSFNRASRWYGFAWFDFSGNYISYNAEQNYSNIQYSSFSAVSPPNAAYMAIDVAGYPDIGGNTIFPNDITDFMLVEGSTPLPYEPYGYKVPVTVEGKNLFDETYPSIVSNTVKYKSIYVGDGQFTLSTTATVYSGTAVLFFLAGIATEGSDSATNGVHSQRKCSVTSIDGYVTIGYRIRGNVDPRNYNTMLNAGSAALPYEPYHAPVTTPIYLPEPIKMVGDEAEYIDYAEQKQHRVRKNYLQASDFEAGAIFTGRDWENLTYQDSKTPPGMTDIGGVVFDTTRKRFTDLITIIGTYTISIADGWEFGIVMFPNDKNSGEQFIYNTEPVTISNCTFAIQLRKTDTSDISSANISDYKIMLNKGAVPLPYEPYIENTDLNVTLPELPVLPGTNTLTVGTEVQPSSVEIKGRIKAAGGD